MCVVDYLSRGQNLLLDENVKIKGRLLPKIIIVDHVFDDKSFIGVRSPHQPGRECLALTRQTINSCYRL